MNSKVHATFMAFAIFLYGALIGLAVDLINFHYYSIDPKGIGVVIGSVLGGVAALIKGASLFAEIKDNQK